MMQPNFTKFVILCHARTGSTLLGSMLENHSDIFWDSENFKKIKKWSGIKLIPRFIFKNFPLIYLNHRARKYGHPVYGCKMAPGYVKNIQQAAAQLHRHKWLVIYLKRQDILQNALSLMVAKKTHHYQSFANKQKYTVLPPLIFSPDDLVNHIQFLIKINELERAAIQNIPHIEICFEEELARPACWPQAVGKIYDALGLGYSPIETNIKKTWEQPYAEMIENYSELIESIQNSPFACLLKEVKACAP